MQPYFIYISIALLAIALFYFRVIVPAQRIKNELKLANISKDTNDAQDEDYCRIAAVISKCKSEFGLRCCVQSVAVFQKKYGNNITGIHDVNELIRFIEKKQGELKVTL